MDQDSDAIVKAYNLYLKKSDEYDSYLRGSKKLDIFRYISFLLIGTGFGLLIGILFGILLV